MTGLPGGAAATRPRQAGRSGRLVWAAAALGLASFTALAFALALAVTMPAQVLGTLVALPPQVEALSGSLWRGRASLLGGHVLFWQASGRDLWRLRLRADAMLEGPDTRLSGRLVLSPWRLAALDWTGRAGPGLLALAPRLLVEGCTSRAVVEVARLGLGRRFAEAEGTVGIAAGDCALRGGGAVAVPAMTLALSTVGRDALADLAGADGTPLARLAVRGDRTLALRVEPEGAALIPGMPTSAPIILEVPF